MARFFEKLVSEKLLNDWALTLDWLFDDMKFSKSRNWNGGYISAYTKKIKKFPYMSDKEKHVIHRNCNKTDFPNQCEKQKRKRSPYIVMKFDDGFARDLIRHIRNGIAHGKADIIKVREELYIEIIDYSDKTKSDDKQTAYLFIPLSYITDFSSTYYEMNKAIMNTTKKDRTTRNKHR